MAKWQQYHASGPNQGFVAVHTTQATQAKWVLEVGPVGWGGPVIGFDGTIYVGTLTGNLVAINPNGTIKWTLALGAIGAHNVSSITGSPAVGKDGNVYVVTTINQIIRDHRDGGDKITHIRRSTLHSVDSTGGLLWSTQFPANIAPHGLGGYTTSSPKVWGESPLHIFVPAIFETVGHAIELLVFSQMGLLVHRADIASYPVDPIVGVGPGIGDVLDSIWDFISSPIDFDTSGVSNGPTLEQQFGWPEPTITIIDYPKYTQPLIVVEDNFKTMSTFRFDENFSVPAFLWTKKSNKVRLRSTVAAFPNGVLAVGEKNGTVAFYDADSGDEIAKPWYKSDKPVMAPPASFGRQVYFCADKKFIVIDADSTLWHEHLLGGKCLGSPALSANFAYVSATDGLYTFSFDLQNFSKNGDVLGGVSSPVIGDDGTVYVMDLEKNLWAFGGAANITKPGSHQS